MPVRHRVRSHAEADAVAEQRAAFDAPRENMRKGKPMMPENPDASGGDYDQALALGRRAFHDRARDTICSCPEKYLLAVGATVGGERRWTPAVPVALLSRRGAIVKAITQWEDTADAEGLAAAIGAVLLPAPTDHRKVEP